MLVSGEAIVLHLDMRSLSKINAMRLLARLVSGIFKNILDMIVKCILQRLGARATDSDICQC